MSETVGVLCVLLAVLAFGNVIFWWLLRIESETVKLALWRIRHDQKVIEYLQRERARNLVHRLALSGNSYWVHFRNLRWADRIAAKYLGES